VLNGNIPSAGADRTRDSQMAALQFLTLTLLSLVLSAPAPPKASEGKKGDDYDLAMRGNLNHGRLHSNAGLVSVGNNANHARVGLGPNGNLAVGNDINSGLYNLHGHSKTHVGSDVNGAVINHGMDYQNNFNFGKDNNIGAIQTTGDNVNSNINQNVRAVGGDSHGAQINLHSQSDTRVGDYFLGIGGNVHGGQMNNNGVVGVGGSIVDGFVNQGAHGRLGVGGNLHGGQFNLNSASDTRVGGSAIGSYINHLPGK